MIIVRLIGGLGNQMFQYAAGRRAAWANNTSLKLDITGFALPAATKREYSLHIFKISESFATEEEIAKLKKPRVDQLTKALHWFRPAKSYYFKEKHFYFDPEIIRVPDNTYIEGYWQSPRYFCDIENSIREEFMFKKGTERKHWEIKKQIESSNSVAVLIRRSDYVSDPKNRKVFWVQDLDYYYKAMRLISRMVKNPKFFVFSISHEDPYWAERHLKTNYPIVFFSALR